MSIYKNKRVLVTGGTGMIGTQLVKLLLEEGAQVLVVSLDPLQEIPAYEYIQGNLMDWNLCKVIAKNKDYVFHIAGIKGSTAIGRLRAASFFVPHILMNTLVMEAARQAGVERYLYTSSIGVYTPAPVFKEACAWDGPPHQEDRFAGWAKRMGELQAEAYHLEYGWDKIAIVRPSNCFGPYDNFDPRTAMVIPALISRIASGENPLAMWGDGSDIRDFLYSKDCAEGMLLALEHGANCMPINLGSGVGIPIKELVENLVSLFPNPPEIVWDGTKALGQSIRLMDITRARSMGFNPKTSLQEGLKETVEWYLKHQNFKRYNIFCEGYID